MLTLSKRTFASAPQTVARVEAQHNIGNVYAGASAMPPDTNDIASGRRQPTLASSGRRSLIDIKAVDDRSASPQLESSKALTRNMNPANVVAVTELLARVEELLRLPAESRETVLRVGTLELDLLTRNVKRDERKIDLRPREFCLLEYMMRRAGRLLTRAVLFQEVWNYKFTPQSNLVDVHIGKLRRKVDCPHEPPMIYNVRGHGFVLRAPD